MSSTGAAIAGGALHTHRRCSPDGLAPVFLLPQRSRPPTAHLLELLKALDARAPAPLPGEKRSERFYSVHNCGELFYRARCGCGRRLLPRTCGDRLCPHCESRRAVRAVKRYAHCFAGREWVRLITLTAKRWPLGELEESVRELRKWFRRLRALLPGLFEGGVYSIETKGKAPHRDDRGGWHTHVHCLAWGCYVDQPELAAAWEKATKGRGRIVDIRAAARDDDGGFERPLREVLKYVTKSVAGERDEATAGWNLAMVEEFYPATKHARLFQKLGNCPKPEDLPEQPCAKCGQLVELCGGHFAHALTREDAERWAAEPEAGCDAEGFYTDAQLADHERRWNEWRRGPAP